MNQHHRALAAATVLVALAAPAFAADPIKVGILVTTTGPYAPWGNDYKQGIGLYLDQHNGKDGNPTVEVIYRDVGGDQPPRARQLAQELVVRDGVAVLGGLEFTTTVLAVSDVITEAKIPFVIFNSASDFVVDKSPYYLRPTFTQWETVYIAGKWAGEQGLKKGAIVSADYAPGQDAIDSFSQGIKDAGGGISDVIKVPLGTTDFSSYFQRLNDNKPQVMYVFMPGGPMSFGMAKGFAERGWYKDGMRLIGGGVNERDLAAIGDAAIGNLAVLNYAPSLDNPVNKEFVAEFTKKYNGDLPTFATVAAYDGMGLIFHMLKETGAQRDGDKMMAAAKGYAWQSPRGPARIDPKTRETIQNIYVTQVEKVDGRLWNKPQKTYTDVVDLWHEAHPAK
ncbi:MAG TPA: ABC transporter substrate-binding protein [Stellaceae bacterium]|nr:ABC transporter substrate-binding protein [Stellaceae bacterium]